MVALELLSSLEVHDDGTIGTELSDDLFFGRSSVEAANVADVLDLGNFRALLVGSASLFERDLVGSAFRTGSVEGVKEHACEDAPTSVTALREPVAGEGEFNRQITHLAILKSEAGLHHANLRDLKAGPTGSLVLHTSSVINSVNVFPVPFFREVAHFNRVGLAQVLSSISQLRFRWVKSCFVLLMLIGISKKSSSTSLS